MTKKQELKEKMQELLETLDTGSDFLPTLEQADHADELLIEITELVTDIITGAK